MSPEELEFVMHLRKPQLHFAFVQQRGMKKLKLFNDEAVKDFFIMGCNVDLSHSQLQGLVVWVPALKIAGQGLGLLLSCLQHCMFPLSG